MNCLRGKCLGCFLKDRRFEVPVGAFVGFIKIKVGTCLLMSKEIIAEEENEGFIVMLY